jgi:hypothetical protein
MFPRPCCALVETQPPPFQAEGEIIAHGLEEVVEGQQDGTLPLVGVTTAELQVGLAHGFALRHESL